MSVINNYNFDFIPHSSRGRDHHVFGCLHFKEEGQVTECSCSVKLKQMSAMF